MSGPPAGYPADSLPVLDALPADRSISAQSINSATPNAAVTSPLGYGQATVGYLISGLTASGATLTPEFTNDPTLATGWTAGSVVQAGAIVSTITADGSVIQIGAPHAGIRLRVSSTGSGNVTISSNASVAAIDPLVYVELVAILAKLNGTINVSGGGGGGGGGPVTNAGTFATQDNGTNTTTIATVSGTPADAAWSGSGSGTLPAILKAIWTKLGAVTATISGSVGVTGTFWQATQPVSLASLPALAAGNNLAGRFGIDQTTPGTTNGVVVNAALPAGTNNLGATAPIGPASIATGQSAMTTSSAQIVAARTGAPGTGRASVMINNPLGVTVYLGPSGVSSSTGFPLVAGASVTFITQAAIFGALASGTGSVAYLETF